MTEAIPIIDYARHPAYGGAFEPDPELGAWARASLAPLVDEMQRQEDQRLERFGYRRGAKGEMGRALVSDAYSLQQLPPRAIERLHALAAPHVEAIRERVALARAGGLPVTFKLSQDALTKDSHPELWGAAEAGVREVDGLAAAAAYYGAPSAKLKGAAVMVNTPSQGWASDLFRGQAETPATAGMHIDSSGGCVMKVVLYLNDVAEDQGPFGVIPGSHLWEQGSAGRVYRRAFDKSALVSRTDVRKRTAFLSLPPEMQVKAEFGGDMPAGGAETEALIRREVVATGPRGQVNIFDPEAIHRGGHVARGERHVMLLALSPQW